MQSSINDEPYVDSFFLPEGILDSEDDDDKLQLDQNDDQGGSGNNAGPEFILPSFLRTQKATWSAPSLPKPSRTDELLLHATADELESNSSLHSAPVTIQRPRYPRFPAYEGPLDGLSQDFGKEQELLYHDITPSLIGSDRSSFSSQASPPPGFESKIYLQSPRAATVGNQPTTNAVEQSQLPDLVHNGEVVPISPRYPPHPAPSAAPPPFLPRIEWRNERKHERKSYARVAAEARASDSELLRQKEKSERTISADPHPPSSPYRANGNQPNGEASSTTTVTHSTSNANSRDASNSSLGASQGGTSVAASSVPSRVSTKQRHSHRRQRKSKASFPASGAAPAGLEESKHRQQPQPKQTSNIGYPSSSLMNSSSSQLDEEGKGDLAPSTTDHFSRIESKPGRCCPPSDVERRERKPVGDATEHRSADISLRLSRTDTTFEAAAAVSKVMSTILLACDVVLPLLVRCLSAVGSIFNGAAKGLILLALGLASTFHYAAAEIWDGAASCYGAFLLLPVLCDLLMATFSLPHFTPHFISTITVCHLCQPSGKRRSPGTRSQFISNDRLAEAVSRSVLRITRYSLLLVEILEGFSESNMSYMTIERHVRILVSYLFALARSNLLLSPVAWTSWSVQLLTVCYARKNLATELLLILIGMASVQLCRQVQTEDELALHDDSIPGNEDRSRVATRSMLKKPIVRL
jgi:hypothetical protein